MSHLNYPIMKIMSCLQGVLPSKVKLPHNRILFLVYYLCPDTMMIEMNKSIWSSLYFCINTKMEYFRINNFKIHKKNKVSISTYTYACDTSPSQLHTSSPRENISV